MKMSGGPASVNIKFALIIVALLIAAGTLFYTQSLVTKLQEKERQIVQLYANGLEHIANSTSLDIDYTFLFDNIIKPIDFPVILTDVNDNINISSKSDVRNIILDSTWNNEEVTDYLYARMKEMDAINKPIEVTYEDSIVLTKIHYGDSDLILKLKYFPYFQIAIATLFLLLGYLGFSNIKRSEQSNIWVGMAKETAHQFGTPISSLMGWLEILKLHYNEPDKVLDTAEEISNDIEKLTKITNRFSKIGAKPEIKDCSVYEEIKYTIDYFQRRLPQTGKIVNMVIKGDEHSVAKLNPDLFEWVIENLIKNALDAIDNPKGKIEFHIKETRRKIEIEVTDNGKGIDLNRRKDVFRPGYSTKRRGWGLGLSLSKRIIEEYHHGKIFVKSSVPGEGTTFKIILNRKR